MTFSDVLHGIRTLDRRLRAHVRFSHSACFSFAYFVFKGRSVKILLTRDTADEQERHPSKVLTVQAHRPEFGSPETLRHRRRHLKVQCWDVETGYLGLAGSLAEPVSSGFTDRSPKEVERD